MHHPDAPTPAPTPVPHSAPAPNSAATTAGTASTQPTPSAPFLPSAPSHLAAKLRDAAHARRDQLVGISHRLHAEPETAFEEHRSAEALASAAEAAGFAVRRGVADLPTAFSATKGSGDLVIAFCAEYDALPGIGHACGHNVNGAATLGAALTLAEVADEIGVTVKLLGTPAEEDSGGKVYLLEAGLFDDVAAAMMVHAHDHDGIAGESLAIGAWDAVYTGLPAHAAAAPWEGVNALDALTVAQVSIGLLRQQLPRDSVVHGIVTEGGQAANVIPERAAAHYEVRAETLDRMRALRQRVEACFEAGALATGARLRMEPRGKEFADLRQDPAMAQLYARAAESLGRTVQRTPERCGSTDMGNVSHLVPAIHPMIGYDTGGARQHTKEFTAAGTTPGADLAVLDGALAMAWTALDVATDPEHRARLTAGVHSREATER